MTKTRVIIITLFLLFLVLPVSVSAFAVRNDESVFVGNGEVIEGNLYAVGNTISIDGLVTGDLICAGQTLNVNGQIDGDIICAGQTININGPVGGSVRTAGNSININSSVARNVQAFGASINLDTEGSVGWDMLVAGATAEIKGNVGGDLHGGGADFIIASEIGGDVKLKLDDRVKGGQKGVAWQDDKRALKITDSAAIGGDLIYTAGTEANIAEGATINGEITRNEPKIKKVQAWPSVSWLWGKLFSIFSALVISLVLISLWSKSIIKLTDRMLERAGPAIGWGAVVLFLTPIIFIILLFTVIGIPLAFILIGVWVLALVLSKILAGIAIGRAVLDKVWHKKKDSLIWAMIIGVIVVYILCGVPFIGWLLGLLAVLWGLGGIWLQLRDAR